MYLRQPLKASEKKMSYHFTRILFMKGSHLCITSIEGKATKNISLQFGLYQVINKPTPSCIDLIFTSQPDLITESGVNQSLHLNSQHQIIFAKFNLEILYRHLNFVTSGTTKMRILILSDE